MKIKKGDTVEVITGKDKGKQGVVEKVLPRETKLLVGGVNILKKHQKATQGQPGGIVEKPGLIEVSNVMLICPSCKLKTRVGYQTQDKKKTRICKKCQKPIK